MEPILIKALQLILSLSILVILHELGHFVFARIFGIRCEKFYLFFNPKFSLVRFKKLPSGWAVRFFSKNLAKPEQPLDKLADNDWQKYPDRTEWGIGWLPLGGYVKIAGMIDESMDTTQMNRPLQPWEFRSQSAWKRLLVMLGGVSVNFLLALAIYAAVLCYWGDTYIPLENARYGMKFSPTAHRIGFADGDLLLRADTVRLERLDEKTFRRMIAAHEVTVLRNSAEVTVSIPADFTQRLLQDKQGFTTFRFPMVVKKPIKNTPASRAGLRAGDSIVSIGDTIAASYFDCAVLFSKYEGRPVKLNFYRSGKEYTTTITPDSLGKIGIHTISPAELLGTATVRYSFLESIPEGIGRGLGTLVGYVSDMQYLFTKEGAESIGGFASIGNLFPAVWDWRAFWEMTAFLSIILAFMNVLPIPALDGGHALFLLYEIVTRRKPSDEFMQHAQVIGMVILLALLLYANGNDFLRFFNG